jgi:hypothetical protein
LSSLRSFRLAGDADQPPDPRTQDDSRPRGYDPSLDETKNRKGIFNMYLLGDRLTMQGMVDVVPIPFSNTPIGEARTTAPPSVTED